MPLNLVISGDYACFSQALSNSHPVSYPIITPAAVHGVLKAIYWHPGIEWMPIRIALLTVPQTTEIYTSHRDAKGAIIPTTITALAKPKYYVEAIALTANNPAGYALNSRAVGTITKRLDRGRCHKPPVLGMSEFLADVRWADGALGDRAELTPIQTDIEIGPMPHYWIWHENDASPFERLSTHETPRQIPRLRTRADRQPVMFNASVKGGVLNIPSATYEDLHPNND